MTDVVLSFDLLHSLDGKLVSKECVHCDRSFGRGTCHNTPNDKNVCPLAENCLGRQRCNCDLSQRLFSNTAELDHSGTLAVHLRVFFLSFS
jgi:hypothetical protein